MVIKKREKYWPGFVVVILATLLMSMSVLAAADEKDKHPALSEQEMLVACADCHRQATPEIEKQWYDSLHGIAMVKCYQCHGTYGEFAVTPSRQNCGICHAKMLEKCPADKPCWECHVPHLFTKNK